MSIKLKVKIKNGYNENEKQFKILKRKYRKERPCMYTFGS